MYKIFYKDGDNETMFYDDTALVDEYTLTNAVLKLSANAAGSLSFTIPIINAMYDGLKRMRGLVRVTKNGNLYWEGRVLSEETDFWGNKVLYCEGALAFLNDTRHPQILYRDIPLRSFIESILSIHNQKVPDEKKFQVGIVTVNNNDNIGTIKTSYESTWEILNSMVNNMGGYLFVRYDSGVRYIDYRKECPRTSYQKIEFGVNLMDFTRTYDLSTLCTVLLPLGETIASAGNNAVGEVMDSRVSPGHYIDPETFDIRYDSAIAGQYKGSSSYFEVDAGKTYYISCRNREGRVMWALKDSGGNLVDYHTASSSEGMTDLVENRLEIPQSDVGNHYYLAIAGFGEDIQPRVNQGIQADEAFDKYTTIENVNDGSVYVVNQDAVTTYGWIEKQLTWSNVSDPTELKNLAERYLREGQFDEMTLEVNALDLQSIGVDADRIDILDEVLVVSKPHGLNKTFPVTELEIKLGDPSSATFKLGAKTEQSLSGVVSSTNDELFAKLNEVPSKSLILESAFNNATMQINNTVSGIFTLEFNERGVNTGFRLSNVEDWDAEGAKGWRFTMGGFGYFGNGYNQPVTVAMTGEDGGLVANCITTGTMYADRIKGGTLTLGGYNNDDGLLVVRNASGDPICVLDNNGADITGKLYNRNASSGYWAKLDDSALFGGYTDTSGNEVETARLSMTAMWTDGTRGLRVDTPILLLYANAIGVGDYDGGVLFTPTATGTIEYVHDVEPVTSQETLVTVDSWDSAAGVLRLIGQEKNIVEDIEPTYGSASVLKGFVTGMGVVS